MMANALHKRALLGAVSDGNGWRTDEGFLEIGDHDIRVKGPQGAELAARLTDVWNAALKKARGE